MIVSSFTNKKGVVYLPIESCCKPVIRKSKRGTCEIFRAGGKISKSIIKSGTTSAIIAVNENRETETDARETYFTQESQKYRDIARQHVDLETIQRRLNDGSYASSSLYLHRDLLLLLTNAVVFFPPNSLHSVAAHQLRALILPHIHKQTQASSPHLDPLPQLKPELERPEPLPARQKASVPLIVCRKRPRPPSNTSAPDHPDRTLTPPVVEPPNKPEKPVTGVRSSRRSNNNKKGNHSSVVASGTDSTPTVTEDEKQKTPATTETKKKESTNTAVASDKKRSATDFLKRIKKNSPAKKSEQKKSGNSNGKEIAAGKGLNKKQEMASPTKKTGGRPVRKAAGDQQSTPLSGKRGKEGASKEGRQPRKRARK